MSVRIGHASIDENQKARGGTAGDQTGKEVCIRSWYDGGWGFLARAKNSSVAEKIAAACEAGCANSKIGYDQNQRNSLNTCAKAVGYDLSRIDTACETDCSAFVSVCVQAAGVNVPYSGGNAPTTSTLKAVLGKTGAFDLFTSDKYLNQSANLHRGDILVKPGKHTVVVLDNGESAVTQTCLLPLPMLKKSCNGSAVRALQMLLIGQGFSCGSSGVDGSFGSATESAVKAYQKSVDLSADGLAGEKTWRKLLGIG